LLAGLVLARLATVVTETVRSNGQTMKVERLRITDAGQEALCEGRGGRVINP
jgi:hypothetical protein